MDPPGKPDRDPSSPSPLILAEAQNRPHRFMMVLRIIESQNPTQTLEAHCPNTGSLKGVLKLPQRALLSPAPKESQRKLRFTLEALEVQDPSTSLSLWVGVNTRHPHQLARLLLESPEGPKILGHPLASLRAEVAVSKETRLDFVALDPEGISHYIEVKNVTWRDQQGWACFPDSLSTRATKHIRALETLAKQGRRATVLYIVQRNDCRGVRPAHEVDPQYASACKSAAEAGVRFRAALFDVQPSGIRFVKEIEHVP